MPKSVPSNQANSSPKKLMFTGVMNSVDFEVMYRVKLKRICMGYSQQEVAFLMGKEKNYISLKEHFARRTAYRVSDIGRLSILLDCENSSFVARNSVKDQFNTYIGYESRSDGKILHEVFVKGKGDKRKLVFKIEEDDPEVINYPDFENTKFEKLKLLLLTLREIGYFNTAKSPWHVFHNCARLLYNHISVSLVEKAIEHFIKEKKLKKIPDDGDAKYITSEPRSPKPPKSKTN